MIHLSNKSYKRKMQKLCIFPKKGKEDRANADPDNLILNWSKKFSTMKKNTPNSRRNRLFLHQKKIKLSRKSYKKDNRYWKMNLSKESRRFKPTQKICMLR